jgi:hypothetical protein
MREDRKLVLLRGRDEREARAHISRFVVLIVNNFNNCLTDCTSGDNG